MYIVFEACESSVDALTSSAYRFKKSRISSDVAFVGMSFSCGWGVAGRTTAFRKRLLGLSSGMAAFYENGENQRFNALLSIAQAIMKSMQQAAHYRAFAANTRAAAAAAPAA